MLLTHPVIADCAVVGLSDEMVGELPKALVVLKPGVKTSEKEIQSYVSGNYNIMA